MGGHKGIPADLIALAVPVAAAALGFGTLIVRSFVSDPDLSNGVTEENETTLAKGANFQKGISGYFKGGSKNLFDNQATVDGVTK